MSQFALYRTEDGRTHIELRVERETGWLLLNQLSDLFERHRSVISRHIANTLKNGKLAEESVVVNFATTAADELIVERAISELQELEKIVKSTKKEDCP